MRYRPHSRMVEAYEYIDGSEGSLKLEENGKSIRFDDPYDVFANKDPRLFASVYLPGSPCQNSKIEWKRGIIVSDNEKYVATSQPDGGNTVEINGITYNTSGKMEEPMPEMPPRQASIRRNSGTKH